MTVALKYSILFVVYGIMMLNRTTTCRDVSTSEPEIIPPELSAIVYFKGMSDEDIESHIFAKPVTLIDFKSYGLAEPLKFLLHLVGNEYKDNLISEEELHKYEKFMPFGQLPVIGIDVTNDKTVYLNQTIALCRYVATRADLVGDKSPWTMLLIDIIVGNVEDFVLEFIALYYEKDQNLKEKLKNRFINTTIPEFVNEHDKIATEKFAYFVQEKLTWADIYGVVILDSVGKLLNIDMYTNKQTLKKLQQNVYTFLKEKNINMPEIL